MRKINTSSLVKSLLVSSTALCGIGFIAPPPHALAENTKAYLMTEVTEPSATSVEINGKYYEISLDTQNIGRDDKHVTYVTDDPGTSTGNVTVTLPVGKDQTLYYTYTKPPAYTKTTTRIDNNITATNVKNKLFEVEYTEPGDEYIEGGVIYSYIKDTSANPILSDFVGNHTYLNNSWSIRGGVIYNGSYEGTGLGIIGSITGDFVGNWTNAKGYIQGGVITNYYGLINTITGDFVGNKTISENDSGFGGAIYSHGGKTNEDWGKIGDIKGYFIGNYVQGAQDASGGAICNRTIFDNNSTVIESITADFIGNWVTSTNTSGTERYVQGGAIHNRSNYSNNKTDINSITGDFIGNWAGSDASGNITAQGGAIYNYSSNNSSATIKDIASDFIGNRVTSANGKSSGGAIYNSGDGTVKITFKDGVASNFIGNYAQAKNQAEGGAIYNQKTITGLNGTFAGNYAEAENNAYAGAIHNANGTITFADDTTSSFQGNYAKATAANSKAYGGAIVNYGTITGLNASFIGNYAQSSGTDGEAYGGAIYNPSTVNPITFDGENTFTGNYAQGSKAYGGALYNGGTVNINDTATVEFSGNYTTLDGNSKTWNDIYNMGADSTHKAIINLYGKMILDGGITGYSDNRDHSELNVFGGAELGFTVRNFTDGTYTGNSNDGTIIANQTVTFNPNNDTNDTVVTFTPIILATNYVKGSTDKYALFDDWDNAVTVDPTVNFDVTQNELYDITFDETTGVFSFVSKYVPPGPGPEPEPESKIKQNILANGGSNNDAILAELLIDPNLREYSANENFNTVMDTVSANYQLGNFNEVVKATKAMNPDEAPVTSNASIDAVQSAFGIAGARLTGVFTPAKEVQKTTGKASGSDAKKEGVWAKGFYGQSKLKGDAGFKNKSWGIGFGFDHQFTPNFMLGVAYAYGQSDIDTDSRDIKAKTHTPVIYGEYKQKKWFIDGMLSYSFGKYDEKKSVTGVNDDVDYDVNTFGAQAVGGYAVTPWFIPEIGFRYFNVSQKDYTDNLGNNFDKKNANVFTGLIGAKFAKAFEASKGVNLVPELRLAASYDFVRDNNEVDVTLANMHSYTFKGEKLDRFGFEVDAGFKVDAGEFELAARYEGRFRNDFYNHTGLLEARYEF